MTPFGLEMRRNRSLLVALVLLLVAYGGIMGLMYPILKDSGDQMRAYMEMFPKEFLAAFGMTGSLADPGIFFTTYVASWLWPIVAAAAGLLVGTRTVAADLDRGFLDLPLSTRISRAGYLATAIGAQILTMAILAAAAVLGLWGAARLVGVDFDLGRFAIAGLLCFALGCAIAGPATLGSVLTLSRGITSAVVGGVLVVMYAVFVVTGVSPDWAWIGPLTAWNHFPTTKVIDAGYLPVGDLALFGAIAIGCWVAAIVAFRGRDLAA
jgi:ABC-type transport system involved in multi-copper enzyme maturation permease subunit